MKSLKIHQLLSLGLISACTCAGVLLARTTPAASAAALPLQIPTAASPGSIEYLSIGNPIVNLLTGEVYGGSYTLSSTPYASQVVNFSPFPTSPKTVKAIRLLLAHSGTYGSGFYLRCQVRNFQGAVLRTVSVNVIELETAAQHTWIDVPLSSTPGDLVLGLGEYLTIYAYLGAGVGGNLTVWTHLLAELQ